MSNVAWFNRKRLSQTVASTLLVVMAAFGGNAYAANTNSIHFATGAGQYLSISDASQNGLDIAGDLTLEAWVKFNSLSGSDATSAVVSKFNTVTVQSSYMLYTTGPSSENLCFNQSADGVNTDGACVNGTNGWAPSAGVWYHVAVVYKASVATAEFFLNGQSLLVTSVPFTSLFNGSADLEIGAHSSGSAANFHGLIDDVRIWVAARTATEISSNMAMELAGNEPGLVAYWKLNNNLADSAANGNTLTNINGATFSTDVPFIGGVPAISKVRKSVDESLSSSTALQDDDELKVSLVANTSYRVDGVLFVTATATLPDIKIGFLAPAGANMTIGFNSSGSTSALNRGGELTLSGAASATIPVNGSFPTVIIISGTIKNGSVADNLQLRWAQNISNGNAITVKQGSYLQISGM